MEVFRNLRKLSLKLDRERRHLEFLKTCKEYDLTPKFMRLRNKIIKNEFKKQIRRCERIILNKIIKKKMAIIRKLEIEIKDEEGNINKSEDDNKKRFEDLERIKEKSRMKHNITHQKKIRNLLKESNKNEEIEKYTKIKEIEFLDYTEGELTEQQKSLIKLGPKYILREDKIDLKEVIPRVETILAKVEKEERDELRAKFQLKLKSCIKKNENMNSRREVKIIKEIKENKNIIVTHTDKTNKIAVINKKKYDEKMIEAIKKLNTEEIKKDMINIINDKIKELEKRKWPNGIKPRLHNETARIPTIFGRVKDHKQGEPLRPIVNRIEGPTYNLERIMKKFYDEVTPESKVCIESTEQFVKRVEGMRIKENEIMISLDVKDLYPSIDTQEIENVINEKFNQIYDKEEAETLISANNLLMRCSYFEFRGKHMRQTKGAPMGSPISGKLAEIKLRPLEEKIIEKEKKIKMWARYVDDTFIIFEGSKQEAEEMLDRINGMDDRIKFTLETEKNNRINFLDVELIRENENIERKVYRKEIAGINIIPNRCRTFRNYKIAAFRSYIRRAMIVPSKQEFKEEEIKKIQELAQEAGYSSKIIENMRKAIAKKIKEKEKEEQNEKKKEKEKFAGCLKYIPGFTQHVVKEMKKRKMRVAIKKDRNIFEKLRNEKGTRDEKLTAGIYEIPYETEEGQKGWYIGQTKRKIATRLKEHERDLKLNKETTALARLAKKEKIEVNFSKARKITNYENSEYAKWREAVEILAKRKETCNDNEPIIIDKIWRNMIKTQGEKTRGRKTRNESDNKTEEGKTKSVIAEEAT